MNEASERFPPTIFPHLLPRRPMKLGNGRNSINARKDVVREERKEKDVKSLSHQGLLAYVIAAHRIHVGSGIENRHYDLE